jgi:hypothetical protein
VRTPASLYVLWMVLAAATQPTHAGEPAVGVLHAFERSAFTWRLDGTYQAILLVFETDTVTVAGRYDLTGCTFCFGGEDNCETDGNGEITVGRESIEPIQTGWIAAA